MSSDWRLNFLVRLDGWVIGSQGLSGEQFAIRREVTTGSWIGMRHQGVGIGTEMRSAVMQFAFEFHGAGDGDQILGCA